jgi:hypothetical protein
MRADHKSTCFIVLHRASEWDAERCQTHKYSAEFRTNKESMSHRSTKSKGRNRKFDTLVGLEAIDTARGKEIRRFLFAAQDLEQHRDGGRLKGHPVYSERPSILIRLMSIK